MEYDPVISVVNAITATGRKARKQGKEYKCQCPAHDDRQSSLQVGRGTKGAVLHCHAGCKTPDIMAALQLPMLALFDNYHDFDKGQPTEHNALRDPAKGALATYIYDDEHGKVLFRVERKRNKQFVQARPNPAKSGDWLYNLGETRRVPFRLANVLGAARDGVTVFVCEGEKDVLTLEAQGLVGTTNPGGAGKFHKDFDKYFIGANVVVLPDNDQPGKEHADHVAMCLREAARTVRVLEFPGQGDKQDVTDWFKRKGNTVAKLTELVEACEVRYSNRPIIFHAQELMAEHFEDIVMAVPGVIAEGLTFLVGAPKIGKSWMSLGLGLAVATGGMALGAIPVQEGPVLYLALEDTPRRLQRRLQVMLAEGESAPANLNFACNWPRLAGGGLEQLEAWLKATPDARMVIIDTWAKVKSSMADSDKSMYDSDYSAVSAVKSLADTYGTAIVFVHHQRKAGDQDPLNTVAGSTGLTGSADAVIVLTRPRGADEGHLYVTGRDVEESRSILSFDAENGSWLYLGEAENVEEQRTEDQVIRLLASAAAQDVGALGPKEIAQALDMKEGTAKWLCAKLATEGKITRIARGKYTTNEATDKAAAAAAKANGPVVIVQPGQQPIPSVSDEEIEALLAEDDGFGGVDE